MVGRAVGTGIELRVAELFVAQRQCDRVAALRGLTLDQLMNRARAARLHMRGFVAAQRVGCSQIVRIQPRQFAERTARSGHHLVQQLLHLLAQGEHERARRTHDSHSNILDFQRIADHSPGKSMALAGQPRPPPHLAELQIRNACAAQRTVDRRVLRRR